MSSCNVMTLPTRITPDGRIGCCSSSPAPVFELPVALKPIRGEDEEWQWESDWVSEWESDWESGGEKELTIGRQKIEDGDLEPQLKRLRPRNTINQKKDDHDSEHRIKRLKSSDPVIINQKNEVDDAEPKLMRLKSMKTLTGDEREFDDEDDDDEEEEEDSDDTDSEEEGAYSPGSGCHYCKCSKFKWKVQCSRCPIRFCGLCLQNRNGEQLEIEAQEGVKWVCPKCRGGCGPGCNNCCTCVPCRRSQGLPPAGQLNVRIARQAGFDNVHDYLIHRQTRESPEKIAKRKEGRGWTKAGAIKGSCSTGITTGKPKTAQIWTPPYCATNWADRQTGLSVTISKDGGDIMKSTNSSMKQRDGERGGASKLSRDIKKPANKLEAWKLKNEQYKKALYQKQKLLNPVLNQVLGREAQKPTRIRLSLDQILNRLLYPEDPAGPCRSGALFGNVQQITRNRKHRNLGRILEPSMFRKRNSKHDKATIINKVTTGFPHSVRTDNIHLQQSSKALIMPGKESTSQQTGKDFHHCDHQDLYSKAPIMPEKQSICQPTLQNVRDGHHQNEPTLGAWIPLKKPVTSLQALRKMGVLAKRSNADLAGQETSQKQGPAIAPRPLLDQTVKPSVQVVASSSPPVPPSVLSEPGSQAILLRHLERRKKIEVRSRSKFQGSPTMAIPSSEKLVPESVERTGQLWSRRTDPQSGFGHLRETRSVRGFELPIQSGVQSGFESFSQKQRAIGFGLFRREETGLCSQQLRLK